MVLGGVQISTGDLVVADLDGVVAVPAAVVGDVLARALEKAKMERTAHNMLAGGTRMSEVWDRVGVL